MWNQFLLIIVISGLTYFSKKINHNEIVTKFKKIRFFFYTYILHLIFIAVAPLGWPIFLWRPKHLWNGKFAARWTKHLSKLMNIKWHLRNGHILAEKRGAVIVANHQSSFDILGILNIWEVIDKLVPIAKKELLYVLPFGVSAYLCGLIFIDRNDPENSRKILNTAAKIKLKNNAKIWIFPEGTRNENSKSLLPFKKGAFHLAVSAQVPIIPVVYSPYYFINKEKLIFNKGHVIIKCLEPVQTKGLTKDDIPDLVSRVRNIMQETYHELCCEVNNIPKNT